jgi:hypothetical protein
VSHARWHRGQRLAWPASEQLCRLKNPPSSVDTIHYKRPGVFPSVLTICRGLPARRFRLARSLYYFLIDSDRNRERLVADSPLVPGRLSEANAFAAELLAPVERLAQLAPADGVWTMGILRNAARALSVSPRVVAHQVENRGLGVLSMT